MKAILGLIGLVVGAVAVFYTVTGGISEELSALELKTEKIYAKKVTLKEINDRLRSMEKKLDRVLTVFDLESP